MKSSQLKTQNWTTNILVYSFSYNKIQKIFHKKEFTGLIIN